MMDRKVFQSTMLQEGVYDSETQELKITFVNGTTYNYQEVPAGVWDDLKTAGSPGKFFNQEVKPLFTFTKS